MSTSYDQSANLWVASRQAKNLASMDPKLLKQNRPHIFIEKPAMRELMPSLENKDVLALGCGSGEEIALLEEYNAKSITGIDLSEELIKIAKEINPKHTFKQMNAQNLEFEDNSFDFIFSSLVMHYFKNWKRVLSELYRVLRPDGELLFSTLHPVKWAAEKLNDEDGKAYAAYMGFDTDTKTGKIKKIYGDYHNTTERTETWMKSLTVTFYLHSVSYMFRQLRKAGFEVLDIYEPKAIDEAKQYDQDYFDVNDKIPNFILFKAKK